MMLALRLPLAQSSRNCGRQKLLHLHCEHLLCQNLPVLLPRLVTGYTSRWQQLILRQLGQHLYPQSRALLMISATPVAMPKWCDMCPQPAGLVVPAAEALEAAGQMQPPKWTVSAAMLATAVTAAIAVTAAAAAAAAGSPLVVAKGDRKNCTLLELM